MTFITGWTNASINKDETHNLSNKIKSSVPSPGRDKLNIHTNSFVTCLSAKDNIEEKNN